MVAGGVAAAGVPAAGAAAAGVPGAAAAVVVASGAGALRQAVPETNTAEDQCEREK